MNKYIYTTILSTFLLSACSSNGPLVHSWGGYDDPDQNKGIYLIEEPYEVKGVWYFPAEQYNYSEQGLASWYIPSGDSALTANGEVYDANIPTARHKTLPLPSIVKITNLENNKTVIARVNDRGPMVNNRLMDVSQEAARELGMPTSGTVMVQVEVLEKESKAAKEQLLNQDLLYQPAEVAQEEKTENSEGLLLVQPAEAPVPEEPPVVIKTVDETVAIEKAEVMPEEEIQKPVYTPMGDTGIAMGSFSNAQNAEKLKTKLAQNYPAYIETVNRNGRTLNVVKVGPYPKAEASEILKQLKLEGYKDAYLVK